MIHRGDAETRRKEKIVIRSDKTELRGTKKAYS